MITIVATIACFEKPPFNRVDAGFHSCELSMLFLIHIGVVEISDALLIRCRVFGRRRAFNNAANALFGLIGQDIERAVAGAISRDFGLGEPCAVDIFEEVIARIDGRIDIVESRSD